MLSPQRPSVVIKMFPKFTKNNLFAIDLKILNLIGFWPANLINFRSFFIVISSLALEIVPEFLFILKNLKDVQKVFMCLHEFVSLLVYLIKITILFFHRKKVNALIENLHDEWFECKFF